MLNSDSDADLYEVIDCGVDWITATAKNCESSLLMERVADSELSLQAEHGTVPLPQSRLGYEGYKVDGLFFGRREHDVMIQASGATSNRLIERIVPLASNVSRLDLQVTLWTEGSERMLATDTWSHLKTVPKGNGRPRSFSLIVGHPVGQTLYLNSRCSDNFARIYDKGIEAKVGPAGLLWRYEVEFKRKVAKHEAAELARHQHSSTYISARVHSWMTARSVLPPWAASTKLMHQCNVARDPGTAVLEWFDASVSKTIAKAIDRHGLSAVLHSLHLQHLVTPKE